MIPYNSDGIHLNDKTKLALKPGAKIRRMTESNVKMLKRPLQSAGTNARLSERTRKHPADNDSTAYRTAYKKERASRTIVFSYRKKPPYAANFHSEGSRSCNDTAGKSARLSLRGSDTSSSSSKPTHVAMERNARDLARMGLELLLNLVPF